METIFIISIVLIIFLLTMLFTFNKRLEIRDIGDYIEEKNECHKIASAINYLYINGPGTKAKLNTNFLVLTKEKKITIKKIKDIFTENKIAAMLSTRESLIASTDFYNSITPRLNPDWYTNCDTEPDITTCSQFPFTAALGNYNDLMNNINDYDTIFIDDIHTSLCGTCIDKTFISKQEEWVSDSHILVLSEHHLDQDGPMFGVLLDNHVDNPVVTAVTVITEDPFFPNLSIGDQITFAQSNRITDDPSNNKAENLVTIAQTAAGDIGLARWQYGSGIVIFLEDFDITFLKLSGQISGNPTSEFDSIMSFVIENGIIQLIILLEESEATCNSELKIDENYQITGKLELENVNRTVVIRNYE
jgi:hypothetical protein